MKNKFILVFWIFCFLVTFPAQGQNTKGEVKTLRGKVIRIIPLTDETHGGAHLELETAVGPVEVHLGPKWVESFQQKGYGAGHEIMVIGMTFRFGNKEEFKVSDIKPVKK